jgi:hypothetical protein
MKVGEEHGIGDFEDGTRQGWSTWYDTTLTVVDDRRAHGNRWLCVALDDYPWAGLGVSYPQPQDWSRYRAIRFSVFNFYDQVIPLCIRADDSLSKEAHWRSRYNDEVGFPLRPGANDLEVTLASLKTGSPGCRGLDVRNIRVFQLFVGQPKQPYTLYLDNVRLVPVNEAPTGSLVLADFDGNGKSRWLPSGTGRANVEKRPDGEEGAALRVTFGGGEYAGVEFHDFEGDWFSYDLLCMDVICPKGQPTPRQISFNVKGADGTPHWMETGLKEGVNHLRVPLDLAGTLPLGAVKSLAVVTRNANEEQVVWLDNIRLERQPGLAFGGAVNPEDRAIGRLTLDFQKIEMENLFSVGAVVWVPLASGETRVLHCTQPRRGPTRYALDAKAFKDMKPGSPVQVWAYIRSKDCWYWTFREVRLKEDDPVTLDLNDLAEFGY